MVERAVTDSTCLIGLARIGQLSLLRSVFAALFAPPAVQAEFGVSVDWLIVRSVSDMRVTTALRTQLDEGEAQVIALAMELDDVFVVLDDKKARRIARQMGLRVIGTLGILLLAKRKGVVTELKPLLNALQQVGFYMTDELYQETLRLAGENT